jgi:hypothetical protein
MRRTMFSVLGACAVSVTSLSQAHALQYITGRITQLEPTYMPERIALQMDAGNAACPAGTWLQWVQLPTQHRDTHSVYATMLSALIAGKRVDFVINDNDATCTGQFFHIYP